MDKELYLIYVTKFARHPIHKYTNNMHNSYEKAKNLSIKLLLTPTTPMVLFLQ